MTDEKQAKWAQHRIDVAEAWRTAQTKDGFDYVLPLKVAAEGVMLAANEGHPAPGALEFTAVEVARAVASGKDTVPLMRMQYEPMRDAVVAVASASVAVTGYTPTGAGKVWDAFANRWVQKGVTGGPAINNVPTGA